MTWRYFCWTTEHYHLRLIELAVFPLLFIVKVVVFLSCQYYYSLRICSSCSYSCRNVWLTMFLETYIQGTTLVHISCISHNDCKTKKKFICQLPSTLFWPMLAMHQGLQFKCWSHVESTTDLQYFPNASVIQCTWLSNFHGHEKCFALTQRWCNVSFLANEMCN